MNISEDYKTFFESVRDSLSGVCGSPIKKDSAVKKLLVGIFNLPNEHHLKTLHRELCKIDTKQNEDSEASYVLTVINRTTTILQCDIESLFAKNEDDLKYLVKNTLWETINIDDLCWDDLTNWTLVCDYLKENPTESDFCGVVFEKLDGEQCLDWLSATFNPLQLVHEGIFEVLTFNKYIAKVTQYE